MSRAPDLFARQTVNLAFSLALLKRQDTPLPMRVGILDLDVFGPSIPTLMGLQYCGEPELTPGTSVFPPAAIGV